MLTLPEHPWPVTYDDVTAASAPDGAHVIITPEWHVAGCRQGLDLETVVRPLRGTDGWDQQRCCHEVFPTPVRPADLFAPFTSALTVADFVRQLADTDELAAAAPGHAATADATLSMAVRMSTQLTDNLHAHAHRLPDVIARQLTADVNSTIDRLRATLTYALLRMLAAPRIRSIDVDGDEQMGRIDRQTRTRLHAAIVDLDPAIANAQRRRSADVTGPVDDLVDAAAATLQGPHTNDATHLVATSLNDTRAPLAVALLSGRPLTDITSDRRQWRLVPATYAELLSRSRLAYDYGPAPEWLPTLHPDAVDEVVTVTRKLHADDRDTPLRELVAAAGRCLDLLPAV